MSKVASPEVVAVLVENHHRFLKFLERRVGTSDEAEEILQAAFVRGVERGGAIQQKESAVAWFYRLLRNALVDYYRRQGAQQRALEREKCEAELQKEFDPELEGLICACLRDVVPTLKTEYAEILTRVDLQEEPLAKYAEGAGLSANNGRVRLHRARRALRKQLERSCGTCTVHGCLDCTCDRAPRTPATQDGCNGSARHPSAKTGGQL